MCLVFSIFNTQTWTLMSLNSSERIHVSMDRTMIDQNLELSSSTNSSARLDERTAENGSRGVCAGFDDPHFGVTFAGYPTGSMHACCTCNLVTSYVLLELGKCLFLFCIARETRPFTTLPRIDVLSTLWLTTTTVRFYLYFCFYFCEKNSY